MSGLGGSRQMSGQGAPAASCPRPGGRRLPQAQPKERGLWSQRVRGSALPCDPDRGPPLRARGGLCKKGSWGVAPVPAQQGLTAATSSSCSCWFIICPPSGTRDSEPPEWGGLEMALTARLSVALLHLSHWALRKAPSSSPLAQASQKCSPRWPILQLPTLPVWSHCVCGPPSSPHPSRPEQPAVAAHPAGGCPPPRGSLHPRPSPSVSRLLLHLSLLC